MGRHDVFRASANKDAAWRFVEYLSEPAVQARFYALSGNLPPRAETWRDSSLANDPHARAFREQLARTAPLPPVPEAELIVQRVAQYAEQAARGQRSVDDATRALDREVDRILEKRRWMQSRAARPAVAAGGSR